METTVNYELIYTDFLGRRQVQNFIKSEAEAIRRKLAYYNSKECNCVIKKVIKTWLDGDCVDIKKTIIK